MNKEDRTYCLPEEVVERLLCPSCNRYISCGPVRILMNGDSICGRCSRNKGFCRNTLFETSMSKFKFPCSYKSHGCKEFLLFGKTIEHERSCPYRSFLCPVLPMNNCVKYVNGLDLYKHFEEVHKNLLIENGQFKLRLKVDSECNFLMKHNEVTFIIQYSYNAVKKNLFLNVAHFSRTTKKTCHYKLQIINEEDLDLAVNCKEYTCRVYNSPTLNDCNYDIFIISDYLKAINNPQSIIIKLVLIGNVENTPSLTLWNLLEKYRCSVCECISLPPVYGHHQDQALLACVYCKSINGYYSTEIKTNETNFPCHWRQCTFVGNENNIKKHIEECEFRTYLCYVESCKTGYYTRNDVINHMAQHGTYCPDPNNIIIDLFKNSSNEHRYFTILENVVIVFRSYKDSNNKRIIHIKGFEDNITYQIKAHFEHDHCLLTSKKKDYAYNSIIDIFNQKFPSCFKTSNYIRGLFSITRK
ncbi:hypothetical protein ILUMI_06788 [Ignelater luminosus]|uniref:SIAH-type domain-containing protein n=1 Tax=Ignelater luminosus TaxID=2038154 RepID=A0A8K0D9A1_IGNLU|nr:hypothetical protein ILUMI_06788 [Ignelater luminosus]